MKRPELIREEPDHISLKQIEDPMPLVDVITPPAATCGSSMVKTPWLPDIR